MPDVSRVSPSLRKQAWAEALLLHQCSKAGPAQLWTTPYFSEDAAVTGLAVGKGHGALANLVPLYWTILCFFVCVLWCGFFFVVVGFVSLFFALVCWVFVCVSVFVFFNIFKCCS